MNDQQLLRYSRQIMLPQMGVEGQQALLSSCALLVGLGGLGSPIAMYLAAAGVGKLMLVDFDKVDLSNLQRQIIHKTDSISQLKVESAKQTLIALNPDIEIETFDHAPTISEWQSLFKYADVIVDASDNFETRYNINKACVKTKTALVSGAAIRYEGQVSVFDLREKDLPCYQCLYPQNSDLTFNDLEQTCSETGVLAPLVGIIGSIQASETIKLLSKTGDLLISKLLLVDIFHSEWRTLSYKKDLHCPICNEK